jgi:hypothetical protein
MSSPELAAAFTDPAVACAYQHRPPYPAQVFNLLAELIADEPRHVLDLGAGEGAIARPLAARVDRVDALDVLAEGRRRPGGQQLPSARPDQTRARTPSSGRGTWFRSTAPASKRA